MERLERKEPTAPDSTSRSQWWGLTLIYIFLSLALGHFLLSCFEKVCPWPQSPQSLRHRGSVEHGRHPGRALARPYDRAGIDWWGGDGWRTVGSFVLPVKHSQRITNPQSEDVFAFFMRIYFSRFSGTSCLRIQSIGQTAGVEKNCKVPVKSLLELFLGRLTRGGASDGGEFGSNMKQHSVGG